MNLGARTTLSCIDSGSQASESGSRVQWGEFLAVFWKFTSVGVLGISGEGDQFGRTYMSRGAAMWMLSTPNAPSEWTVFKDIEHFGSVSRMDARCKISAVEKGPAEERSYLLGCLHLFPAVEHREHQKPREWPVRTQKGIHCGSHRSRRQWETQLKSNQQWCWFGWLGAPRLVH